MEPATYVLLFWMTTMRGIPVGIASAQFAEKTACEAAIVELQKQRTNTGGICVPSGNQRPKR